MNSAGGHRKSRRLVTAIASCAALVLTACSSVNVEDLVGQVNQDLSEFSNASLQLAHSTEQRSAQERKAAHFLAHPLSQDHAVQLALVNHSALQALLARHWAEAAQAAQTGRIPNPSVSFERSTMLDEVEIGRRLSFGLLDVLTIPLRMAVAERGIARAQLQLTNSVIDHVTLVRQAWVKAVAARQNQVYVQQVFDAAEASAELARRMQAVGNFSKLQRARQQSFYADAATQKAIAQHEVSASTEALVRALGLSAAQAGQLQLPDRLPDLPKVPRSADAVSRAARAGRMDVKLAQATLEAAAKAQGLNQITSLVDVEIGFGQTTSYDNAAGTSSQGSGYEISLKLPLFDFGGIRRDAMNAHTLAAARHLEATVHAADSNLRESYSAYRTAFDIAWHYRTEVLPLRQLIADESVLRYNGMLIGVFELLAESRNQVASVMAAIAAEQQFWLADAALQASQIGRATAMAANRATPTVNGDGDAAH
ncbi:MAG: TolC family protein [Rhodoferax sp.]|nr:TolC family protein [Rhodoferax sp.]